MLPWRSAPGGLSMTRITRVEKHLTRMGRSAIRRDGRDRRRATGERSLWVSKKRARRLHFLIQGRALSRWS
jgi:hypothetical protein